jgi:hypothetical protein
MTFMPDWNTIENRIVDNLDNTSRRDEPRVYVLSIFKTFDKINTTIHATKESAIQTLRYELYTSLMKRYHRFAKVMAKANPDEENQTLKQLSLDVIEGRVQHEIVDYLIQAQVVNNKGEKNE